jgi:transcriptional regulator with XRE-family HTH domain
MMTQVLNVADKTGELARWLQQQLYDRRITQRGLAKRAGISPATVNNIATGRYTPTASVLRQIAVGLGDTPAEIEALAREMLTLAGYIDEPAELTNNEKIAFLAQQLSELPAEMQEALQAQIKALLELYRRKESDE